LSSQLVTIELFITINPHIIPTLYVTTSTTFGFNGIYSLVFEI